MSGVRGDKYTPRWVGRLSNDLRFCCGGVRRQPHNLDAEYTVRLPPR
jgi:hypothetical protein